jgi:hypothetical protein
MMGIVFWAVETRQGNSLTADNSLCSIAQGGIDAPKVGIRLGTSDEKCTGFVKTKESLEIQVGSIQNVNSRWLRDHHIEHVYVVQFPVGYMYKARDVAPQIQQRMHLYRCFGASKWRPWQQRQAQVYRGRVQCVNRVLQIQSLVFFGIELAGLRACGLAGLRACGLAGLRNQSVRKLGIDTPVSSLVGIGQRQAFDSGADSHVVQLRREAGFDIPQAFPIRQLCKGKNAKMLGTRQYANPMISIATGNDSVKRFPRKIIHDLRKQRLSRIHANLSAPMALQEEIFSELRSSRGHPKCAIIDCQY